MRRISHLILYIVLLLIMMVLQHCRKKETRVVWDKSMPIIGSQSSPRASDLNEDGVPDIVMGAGKNEYQFCDQAIIALDGKTGETLWEQSATDQVYGSATFYDITDDGITDVFIGGRSPHLKALNGKTGAVIWEYNYEDHQTDPILQYARFNFNNSVLIPDQNKDGFSDLLTVNGGNSKASPNSEVDRFPGVLIIFNSRNGDIIAADTMPDGKESYMSPLCFKQPGSSEYQILFGTGGETIDGHLYLTTISDLMNSKLDLARIIASEKGHGFIAPPVLADINNDHHYDIVTVSHGSRIVAIDGKSENQLWEQRIKNTESSNSFAVGYFTDDDTPDFFTFVSKGQWPHNAGSLQVMLDGKTGEIVYQDSMGCTGFSSPVVYDLDNDGFDEAIISINEFDCSLGFAGRSPQTIENKLIAIDFKKRSTQIIDQGPGHKNIFSTPWIGDLDDDGYLDLVHCQYYHRGMVLSFLGTRIRRIDLPVKIVRPVSWGSYMGSEGNGIFELDSKP